MTLRPATAGLAAFLALAAAGCGDSGGPGGIIPGSTLTVYSNLPVGGRIDAPAEDVVRGEKLALAEARGRAGSFDVRLVSLDDSPPDASFTSTTVADNARRAIHDPSTIAYLGDRDPAATRVSIPILDEAGILQVALGPVSPALRAPDLYPSARPHFLAAPPSGVTRAFRARFRRAFGTAPGPSAATGYDAMRATLRAIAQAGSRGSDRQRVIDAFRTLTEG
jgi:ABC-type branched-subunit amino acid transport system substrate-binding protein